MLPHAPDGLFIATALPAPPGRGGGRRASASGLAPLSSMCAGARGRAEDDGRDRGLTHNRGFAFDRPVRSSYRVSNPNRERDGTSNEARGRTPRTPRRARAGPIVRRSTRTTMIFEITSQLSYRHSHELMLYMRRLEGSAHNATYCTAHSLEQ